MSGLQTNSVLTPLQKDVLACLFSRPWFFERFFLTGGTALSAFYLEHRKSDDLDFFTHEPFPVRLIENVEAALHEKGMSLTVVQRTPGYVRALANDSLKLDFVHDTAARFGVPATREGIRIDTEENIAVNKVTCLLSRLEVKDYVDLYFLLDRKKYDVWDLLKRGKLKDGGLEPFVWARLIGDAETFTILPRMLVPLDLETIKQFYRELRKAVVGRLKP